MAITRLRICCIVTASVLTGNFVRQMDNLWRYDVRTHQLMALGDGALDVAWDGNHLYALLLTKSLDKSVVEVTPEGLKPVPQLPLAVQRAFTKYRPGHESTVIDVEENSRYVVSSNNPCHGCGNVIRARRKGSSHGHVIATDQDGFLFDRKRSVVIYPKYGVTAALVAFDLDSGHSRMLALPTPYIAALLDGRSEPDGYLVAFSSAGPCLPKLTPEGQNLWLLPLNDQYRRAFALRKCLLRESAAWHRNER